MVNHYSFAERFIRLNIIKRFWRLVHTLVGFASSFIMLTALSVHEYGLYQLVLAAAALTDTFSINFFDEVVSNDISRALSDNKGGTAKRLFHELVFLKIGIGVLVAATLFLGANLVAEMYGEDIGLYIRIASFLVVISAFRSAIDIFIRSVVSLRSQGASAIEDIIKLGIILGFFFFSYVSISRVLIATIIGASASLIYVCFGFFPEYLEFFRGIDSAKGFLFKGVVKTYGKWVLFRAAVKRIAKPSRPWLIVTILNVEAVALYSLSTNLVTTIKEFFPNVGSSIIAWEVKNIDRLKFIFTRGIKYSFVYGLVLTGLSLFFIPQLVGILFPKYIPAMPLFYIFLIAVPFHGIQTLEMEILTALREQKILTARIIAEILLGSGLIIALVPFVGVLATGIGPVAAIFWRTWFLYRQIVKKYPELKPDRKTLFGFDAEDKLLIKRLFVEMRAFFKRQPGIGGGSIKNG